MKQEPSHWRIPGLHPNCARRLDANGNEVSDRWSWADKCVAYRLHALDYTLPMDMQRKRLANAWARVHMRNKDHDAEQNEIRDYEQTGTTLGG